MWSQLRRGALATFALLAVLANSGPASAVATPAGYSLSFHGAVEGDASGGTISGCAFDPLGLPKFAAHWNGFTVDGVPHDLYLFVAGKGSFKAGDPIPVTNDRKRRPSATVRITSGNHVFNQPETGSVHLSPDGIGVLDAALGPRVHGKLVTVHGTFVCAVP